MPVGASGAGLPLWVTPEAAGPLRGVVGSGASCAASPGGPGGRAELCPAPADRELLGGRWGRTQGPRRPARRPHLRQPVALKKTSGSTASRDRLLLPSHQPEKGMMTRSASTGRASAMSSSFSSSVEDRFQSSPAGGGGPGRAQGAALCTPANQPPGASVAHPLDLAAPAPVPLPHGAFESFLCGPRWCPREAVFRRDRHVRSLTERSRPAGHGRSAPGLRRCPVLSGAAERLVLGPALRASVVLDTGRMRKTCGPRTPAPTSPKVCSGRAVAGHQPSTPRPLSSEGPRPPVTLHSAWVDPPGPHGLLRGVPGYEAGLGPALTESRPRGRAPYRSAASGSPCSRSSAGG